MSSLTPDIEESWKSPLHEAFSDQYFIDLKNFLIEEKKQHIVYPKGSLIFNAFNQTPFDAVKVVILGQDPYHGPGQAHGLCFSVPEGIPFPPSLRNILKEIREDIGKNIPPHGNLERWAKQGVLLLNATLTVRANQAGSHQKKGWENFTDTVIKKIADERENIVFMLWGRYARDKKSLIDESRHCVLEAAHPSPLSAHNGFFGCRHFSKANKYLISKNKEAIDW